MDEVRWLSAQEQCDWRAFLDASRQLLAELDRQLQRDAGISMADYELLVRLSEAPEHRMRMSELAEVTLFSRSRLSHAVSRLEVAGWVLRTACVEDGRGLFAQLTEDGEAKLAATAPGHVAAVRASLLDVLTPEEFHQIGRLSARIRQHLDG